MDEIYGKIAYEAYSRDTKGRSLISGDPLPQWDELSTPIQHAWIAAAFAVMDTAKSVGDI